MTSWQIVKGDLFDDPGSTQSWRKRILCENQLQAAEDAAFPFLKALSLAPEIGTSELANKK